jgi:hypothetical protein
MKRNFAHNDLSGERVEVLHPDPCVVHRGSGKGLDGLVTAAVAGDQFLRQRSHVRHWKASGWPIGPVPIYGHYGHCAQHIQH